MNLALQLAEIEKQVSILISENIEYKKQLTKAKELLTRFVMASVFFNGKEIDLIKEAEQYLKENK